MSGTSDDEFQDRRLAARQRIFDEITDGETLDERRSFFDAVYEMAGDDAAAVPWADLKPKPELADWLQRLPEATSHGRAVDVACGLGDNAEALAKAGFDTTAFDFSERAVAWAKRRFRDSVVDYCVADLFDPPSDWIGAFDLVNECYTLQSMSGDLRERAFAAIADLVRPGGRLLMIARTRDEGAEMQGPPWPLKPSEIAKFEDCGLQTVWRKDYVLTRPGRIIPHAAIELERTV